MKRPPATSDEIAAALFAGLAIGAAIVAYIVAVTP
jgi:hypothetical protein